MLTSKELRVSFTDFFASKNHQIVASAPMVIKGDPTLMFTNAGMNQFKDIILGNVPAKYIRVADSQKCLRVSGKHNDLEEVGHDTYHHTMFEMLGNWSFGDYFKSEAIAWAWEYLTTRLHLDPDRLYATVFEGSVLDCLGQDAEAAEYWARHLPQSRILNGCKKDNFWEMGDTGPCGPCSEIHIDLRPDDERASVSGAELVNKDHPQVIEIWNLVFMQFNRKADGSLEPLPARGIDTGMGFERLCMAIQGKTSNYDTDIFQPIIQRIAALTGIAYGDDDKADIAMRVVADHIRTIAFSITDGQLPSNAKAGYVIRRILRRAVRYAYTFLNIREAFMYRLLPALIESMGSAYPELDEQKSLIARVIKEEEEAFLRTLDTGIRLLDKKTEEAIAAGLTSLSGKDAFALYDSYGFPLDLTELILRERGIAVDINSFNIEMQKQKERARNAAAVETGDWLVVREGESRFVGYDCLESDAEILRYRKVKQKNKEFYQIVLDQTPFYAEKGGQVGDSGQLVAANDTIAIVDTKSENNLAVHLVEKLPADIAATFTARVDIAKRLQCECNHSGTHLLHQALREVLGTHVEQRGSYVAPESLRFDFSHFQKLTEAELREVERRVGEKIRADYPLDEHRSIPIAQAKAMGAIALFGEKYGDDVRVIRYGSSVELCGGTHIPSTGRIGSLRIIAESSIAAGVRRIEAVTAEGAESYYFQLQDTLREIRNLTNNMPDLIQTIKKNINENAELRRQIDAYDKEKITSIKHTILANIISRNGLRIAQYIGPGSPELIKDVAFQIKSELKNAFIFVAGIEQAAKPTLMLMLSDELVSAGKDAARLIKSAAALIQGGGGGQPHFATAGGKNPTRLKEAVESILKELKLEG
ncbi:MAG: alanine--tRNA ligase [Tannerellaceae bacterium]|jgi:alanyl-tRNA synthetase|nr:alanine--tRNA ligase [Tannerellaceae bacterium]